VVIRAEHQRVPMVVRPVRGNRADVGDLENVRSPVVKIR
jgi:hypothetical protein